MSLYTLYITYMQVRAEVCYVISLLVSRHIYHMQANI
jgi:hypothetical protein